MSIARHPMVMFAPKPSAGAGYLLDTYTAAMALTLRQLKTAQGDIVRVRRSSDSTADFYNATEISDGTLTAFTGAGSGFIEKWICATGSGRELIQNTTSIQTRIVNTGVLETENGKAAIQSVTGNELENAISSLNLNSTNGFMFFLVNKPNNNSGNKRMLSLNSFIGGGDYTPGGINWTTSEVRVNNTTIGLNAISLIHSVHKFICVPGGNTYTKQNGTTKNTASTPTFNIDFTNMAVMNELSFNRSYFDGKFQELLIFNYYDATDEIAIENDIKTYYGITY